MEPNTAIIDIETLSTKESAVVVTVSAFKFDRFANNAQTEFASHDNELHMHLDVADQLIHGRTTNAETCKWWRKQSAEALSELRSNDLPFLACDALEQLAEFIHGCQLFSRGTDFDFKILGHMYRTNGIKTPWKYNQVRDVRTYIDAFTGGNIGYVENFETPDWMTSHNSLHDCYRDAMQMVKARVDFIDSVLD
ncbi:3'-5' exonuclease [Salinivibrio kushneri]|uniref:3'-5' exoribonuclease Rv2179c-like domain-containing protein n=1 Tax=Salinivibrio kushneri TaxID=1908198 RepID=A0AB36K844_9GAMM|nr:3'-5' exonuclease [Salinivibrio kushneri]OOE45107.1 hypothetical protein BZG09_05220 [Salinivibrio kushneri]